MKLENIIVAIAILVVVAQVVTVALTIRTHRVRMARFNAQGEQIDRMLDHIEQLADLAATTTDSFDRERIFAEIEAKLKKVNIMMEIDREQD